METGERFIQNLKKIMLSAGGISIKLRGDGLNIKRKKDGSPVTNADIEVSNFIYAGLKQLSNDVPIICEEQPHKDISNSEMFWLVDPIDGTKSYLKNLDSFTINIALIQKRIPVTGLVYQPTSRKLYFTDNEGRFRLETNGIDTPCPSGTRNNASYVAVVSSRNFNAATAKYISENNFSEVISIPSSIKLCMVAEGSADVYPKFGPTMEWDTAAGHALINAAGGKVIDHSTGHSLLYGKSNFKNPDFSAYNKR